MISSKEKLSALKKSVLFSGLTEKECAGLISESLFAMQKRHSIISEEGEKCRNIILVSDGLLRGFRTSFSGKEVGIDIFGTGDVIWDNCLLNNFSMSYSVGAITDASLLYIKKENLEALIRNNRDLREGFANQLSKKLIAAQNRLVESACEKVEQRLARALLVMLGKVGSCIPCTRYELAMTVGTTLETTIRVTGRMKKSGILSAKRGKIFIKDKAQLSRLSEGLISVQSLKNYSGSQLKTLAV